MIFFGGGRGGLIFEKNVALEHMLHLFFVKKVYEYRTKNRYTRNSQITLSNAENLGLSKS